MNNRIKAVVRAAVQYNKAANTYGNMYLEESALQDIEYRVESLTPEDLAECGVEVSHVP